MSIDSNKYDFELALDEMQETIELLDNCVDDALIGTLNKVVNEYTGHFQSDIEELIDKAVVLQDKIDDLTP